MKYERKISENNEIDDEFSYALRNIMLNSSMFVTFLTHILHQISDIDVYIVEAIGWTKRLEMRNFRA